MNVEAILKIKGRAVATIEAHATVGEACATLAERRIGALVVVREGEPVGIISERDVVRALAEQGAEIPHLAVEKLMTRDLVTGDPGDDVATVMRIMTERRIRHLPILRNDRLCGLVSIGDVVKVRIEEVEFEAESLRSYVAS